MQKSLVIGASGFIGTRLVRALSRTGEVVALDIAPAREQLPGVRYVTADVREPLDDDSARGVDTIYNLAAVHRTPGHPAHAYYETNVHGALNVTALAERAGIATILFTSSISVYGETDQDITEASPLTPTSDYGRSKLMAESIHRRWRAAEPGRKLVAARPGVVFGPGERGNYTRLVRALRAGYFLYPGARDTVKGGGFVDELLRTFQYALDRPEPDITFNFAYPVHSATADIVATIGEVEGLSARPLTVPAGPVMSVARVLGLFGLPESSAFHPERVRKLLISTRVVPAWLASSGYAFETDLRGGLAAWLAEDHELTA